MTVLLLACTRAVPPTPDPEPEPIAPPRVVGFAADPRHTGVSPGSVGTDLAVAWKAPVGVQGWHSSPLVVGDRVVVGSYGETWNTCDPQDGVYVVARDTGRVALFVATGCDANGVSSDGSHLYAVTDAGNVVAMGLDGTRVFETRAHDGKLYAAPSVLPQGLLVSGSGGFLALLDPATGGLRKRLPATGSIRNHSVLDGRVAYGTEENGVQICMLDGSGCVGWQSSGDRSPIYGAPAMDGNDVAVPGGYDGSASNEQMALIDVRSGELRWSHAEMVGTKASPALADDVVIFAESGYLDGENPDWPRGRLRAYDRATGAARWEVAEHGGSWSSPVIVGDRVVWLPASGPLLVLDRATGETLASLPLQDRFFATPAVVDGTIYVGGDSGNLYAITTGATP